MNTEEFRKELPGLERAFQAWMKHQGIRQYDEGVFLSYALAASMCRVTNNVNNLDTGIRIMNLMLALNVSAIMEQQHERNPNTPTDNRT